MNDQQRKEQREQQRIQEHLRQQREQSRQHNEKLLEQQRQGMSGQGTSGGNQPPACFPSETRILTSQRWKKIVDINNGDEVLSMNKNGILVSNKVIQVLSFKPRKLFEVQTEFSDFKFCATKNHSIRTGRGWVKVNDLQSTDTIVYHGRDKSSNKEVAYKVRDIVDSGRVEPVYNLIVENDFNFIAEGCLAHSFSKYRMLLTNYYRVISYGRKILNGFEVMRREFPVPA